MTHPVTDRQVEALAQLVLKRRLTERLDGSRDRHGPGISGLIGRLEGEGLVTPRGLPGALRVTREGLDTLAENVGRILPAVDDIAGTLETAIRAAMRQREGELDAEDATEADQLAAYRADRDKRETERMARIPAKLRELAVEHCGPTLEHGLAAYNPDKLVAFWRAIVDADAAL